jgi:hypothetical protein
MWKTCQASTSKSKVITPHSKPLPRRLRERNLAGFIPKLGILKIEGKNKKAAILAAFSISTKRQ